jgi:predicted kinase
VALRSSIPGAGRSTWAPCRDLPIISYDDVQKELTGSVGLCGDEVALFREMRRRAAMLMRSGSDVIIYTTNIDATERLPNVNLVPPDIPVRSVIVDRPNGPKQNDDGRDKGKSWRCNKL